MAATITLNGTQFRGGSSPTVPHTVAHLVVEPLSKIVGWKADTRTSFGTKSD
jgi:hypothetical protein